MTIILDRNYSLLDKKEKIKINDVVKKANMPVQAPNNFPKLIRHAIKQTANVQKTTITQEKYYDEFLSQLDTSMEFISSNDFKPTSPTQIRYLQKMFPDNKFNSTNNQMTENYYYSNFNVDTDKDYITFNTYKNIYLVLRDLLLLECAICSNSLKIHLTEKILENMTMIFLI